jgi:Type IV secretion system pilin
MKNLFLAQLINKGPLPRLTTGDSTVQSVLNIIFVVLGALAFLMLVISGFRYIMYGSDPNKLSEVKRQIAYILVGIIVVALAATIVNFAINRVA